MGIRHLTRSWDLMPPDVVRPLASTTLGTLVAIAHRIGMTWVDWSPRGRKLQAEGMGQNFMTTHFRGLRLVVDFHRERGLEILRKVDVLDSFYVPSAAADKVSVELLCATNSRAWLTKLSLL